MKKSTPQTAKELILSLPHRFQPEANPDWNAVIHLHLKGDDGGNFEVVISNGEIKVNTSHTLPPTLTLKTSPDVYYNIEFGKTDPKTAFFFGKISVSNISEMAKLNSSFTRAHLFYQ